MTLETQLEWLFGRQRFGVRPGLTRIAALLAALGNPQERFKVVLVGGTNGKGSTAATLASILRAAGLDVGLFTSPHLTRFAERFVVKGQELPSTTVAKALKRVRPLAEELEASFFEIVTALGCLLFAEAGVQWAVMEVGVGGRWDSTNALEPELSIVTNVALDHTAILGETLEAIAGEKAGILRPHRPAVTGVEVGLLPLLRATGADVWALDQELEVQVQSLAWQGSAVSVASPRTSLTFRTPLLGEHGARNAALAVAAALRLGIVPEAIQRGAEQTSWPGRLEVLDAGGQRFILDGAHNPDGARALAETLRQLGVPPLPIIFGAAADKDVAKVAAALTPLASRVILTRAALSPRAAEPHELQAHFPQVPTVLTESPAQALQAVQGKPLTLVCGSLYLLGEIRPLLTGAVGESWERWQ